MTYQNDAKENDIKLTDIQQNLTERQLEKCTQSRNNTCYNTNIGGIDLNRTEKIMIIILLRVKLPSVILLCVMLLSVVLLNAIHYAECHSKYHSNDYYFNE